MRLIHLITQLILYYQEDLQLELNRQKLKKALNKLNDYIINITKTNPNLVITSKEVTKHYHGLDPMLQFINSNNPTGLQYKVKDLVEYPDKPFKDKIS